MTMSESGHAKNIAEFETLVNFITNLGDIYQSANDELKLDSLNAKLTAAKDALTQTQDNFTTWKDVTNRRETAFESSGRILIRAANSFAASGAAENDIADAKSFVRKTQGRRASEKNAPAASGEPVKTYAVAQTAYDDKVEHFAQFVSILKNSPKYAPNEADLKTAALDGVLADLRDKNSAVINANVALSNARINRDQILYDEEKGLVQTAFDVKKYLKSVFGASSPQYKQISGLKFKHLAR